MVFLYLFILFLFIFLIFICLPSTPACLGSPGWVCYAWVTRDVTGNSVPLWVPPPHHARALSATCLVVSTLACIASSDRHCGIGPVFLALGCWNHFLSLSYGSLGPGWCLNSSLQRTFVLTSLTVTLDLTFLQHTSWDMATASYPTVS